MLALAKRGRCGVGPQQEATPTPETVFGIGSSRGISLLAAFSWDYRR